MAKISKKFTFNFPISESRTTLSGLRWKHYCDLTISGIGYKYASDDLYDVDIEDVIYEGINIYPLLRVTEQPLFDDINDAAYQHVADMFAENNIEY